MTDAELIEQHLAKKGATICPSAWAFGALPPHWLSVTRNSNYSDVGHTNGYTTDETNMGIAELEDQ